ncbi:hypothetical protein [Methylobacterium indicum]|uniref:hypothetical protein n=1 Tax=Methylobacterium indicum TaxID=1775910 RepID=UPI000F76EF79|nr:hypothetical protein [Methylobacterium indicum]
MRTLRRSFILALAIIGFFGISGTVGLWIAKEKLYSSPNALVFIDSPDGAFRAAVASYVGGGGFSPYCFNRLFVVDSQTPADRVADENNLVAEGECGSFGSMEGGISDPSDVSWSEVRTLTARISLHSATTGLETFRIRKMAASGHIRVEFEVRQ